MNDDLPDTLARYFEAQNDHDAEGMSECFVPDATVRDEGRTYVGRDAIRAWKLETIAKYGIAVEPLEARGGDRDLAVVARVSGNFPGSPAQLTYKVRFAEAGLIHRLEIA